MSTHSVRRHLRVEIDAYDETIRRFIPGYDEMLRVASSTLASVRPEVAIDLGAGTGALSAAILTHGGTQTVELIDVDDEMLAQARMRLAPFGARVRFRKMSFADPLPPCDAAAASLALHHVPTLDEKQAVYEGIRAALRPGGIFVNADAVMPADPAGREASYDAWADHMVECGIERARALEHFAEWAEEDTYFPLEEELAAMRAAGLDAECVWRNRSMAVVAGRARRTLVRNAG